MNHDEPWSVSVIRQWASLSERALRCIEILASESDMTVEELMDKIEDDA